VRLIPIWSPADFTETISAAQEHDRKWADLPRIRGKALPSPDGCPSQAADEATARIVADLWWLANTSRTVLERLRGGGFVACGPPVDGPQEVAWPVDPVPDMITRWRDGCGYGDGDGEGA